jgi:O-antigen/teichoic acid export membrane protein
VIGRAYSAEEFAAYGIGLSIGLMLQGIQRHTVTIPLMLQPARRVERRIGAVLGEQLLTLALATIVGGIVLVLAHAFAVDHYGLLIVASTVVLLFIYLQLEFARAFLVKIGKPWLLPVSAGWYCAVSAALSLAAFRHALPYEGLLAVLAAAMLLHAAVIVAIAGFPSFGRGWLRFRADARRYGGWASVATLTYTGYNHVPLLMLGALAAPVHAAAFVAARSLLQPLQILLRGFDIADKMRFSEVAGGSAPGNPLTLTLKIAGTYAVIGAMFGGVVVLFADRIIVLAYGAKFAEHSAALIAWVPVYVLLSITLPLESLVYARGDFARYYAVRGLAAIDGAASAASVERLHGDHDVRVRLAVAAASAGVTPP